MNNANDSPNKIEQGVSGHQWLTGSCSSSCELPRQKWIASEVHWEARKLNKRTLTIALCLYCVYLNICPRKGPLYRSLTQCVKRDNMPPSYTHLGWFHTDPVGRTLFILTAHRGWEPEYLQDASLVFSSQAQIGTKPLYTQDSHPHTLKIAASSDINRIKWFQLNFQCQGHLWH